MNHLFDIDQSFIKALDDETARELIARLCRAELRAQGLPESSVTWGGDQRAKDGGVDVRVDCSSPLQAPDFIRTAHTAFQVKAEKFPPSKILNEMQPKGSLRPAVIELKETDGAYIIVSTQDDVSDSALQARRDAIRLCLSEYELGTSVQSDFYDSRRIADWVERQPSIAAWLRQKVGRPLKGWKPYGPWAYSERDIEAEYLVDDRVRIFVPGAEEGSSVTDAIEKLRRELEHNVSIRIVGLSGVGKTRLVQALFDARVCSGFYTLSSENVIYADLADEPEPQPQAMLEDLQERGSDTIVVIDNCGPDTHERLTRVVKSKGSHLKLITVEYDIRDDLPEDTLCYRLEGSSPEIIKKLLKNRYQMLSDSDTDRIVEFSDGNARVAFALASTVETGGELSQLRSRELFERLFHQKNIPNDELLRCAEAASLLYSFDGEDFSSSSEIALLATFAEMTPQTFFRHMAELKRRGLLQERGRWRAVLPHAIANGLAERMLQSSPSDLLHRALIEQGSERIARSFSRRLGFLHDSQEATVLTSRLLSENGKLGNLAVLSDFEKQMFCNLAPVDPLGAIEAIGRAIKNYDFLSPSNPDRMRFARVVRSIAYEPEFFDYAASILIQFALAEPEGFKREPIRDVIKSLFYCYLSGTQASPEQRRTIVERLISSNNEKEQGLGFDLLQAGLEASHFSSHYGFEFGARHRDFGWHPRSQADVKSWFKTWIEIVAAIGEQNSKSGQKARTILGEAWRGLWGRIGLDDELVDVAKRLSAIDGWPEGWLGVRRALQWGAKSLTPTSLVQLKELEKSLAPGNLVSEVRARVLARGTFAYDFDDEEELEGEATGSLATGKYRRAQMKAEALGANIVSSPELLNTLIVDLCSKSHGSNIYNFGRGVGKHHQDMPGLLAAIRSHIKQTDCNDLNLIWVRGLLCGWDETDHQACELFLDEAINDAVWRNWFVELQVQVALNSRAVDRLLHALDPNQCPTWQFVYLAWGRTTDTLTVSQIVAIANKLSQRADRGTFTAIDILASVVRCAEEKDDQYKDELGQMLLEYLGFIDWSILNNDYRQNDDYDLDVVIIFALRRAGSEKFVTPILRRMLQTDGSDRIHYGDVRIKALKPFFTYFPRLALDMVCIPDEDGTFERAEALVSASYSEHDEAALELIPTGVLIDWCNEKPGARHVFAAGACKLFEKQEDQKMPLIISDSAVALLETSPNKVAVVAEFVQRFHPRIWSGSLADILEVRLPLLDQLAANGDESRGAAITSSKSKLQQWIDSERAREQAEERSRNSSFE